MYIKLGYEIGQVRRMGCSRNTHTHHQLVRYRRPSKKQPGIRYSDKQPCLQGASLVADFPALEITVKEERIFFKKKRMHALYRQSEKARRSKKQ